MGRERFPLSYARRGPVREEYDTVLIVCEGSKTEPNYLNGLKSSYRLSSANIRVTNAPGTDPLTVVEYTESIMQADDFDRAFSVFDRDGHPNFDEAVRRVADSERGRSGTWQAITSTPCFEVWLMLHYGFSTAPIVQSRTKSAGDMAISELRKYLPDYAKGHTGIYEIVKEMTDAAIRNAVRLARHNQAADATNPATDMHLLVDYLRKLKA